MPPAYRSEVRPHSSNSREVPESRFLESVHRRLYGSGYPAVQRLRCYFHEGVLTVRGRVESFHERQLAWALLGDLEGVEEFVDRIEVIADVPRSER